MWNFVDMTKLTDQNNPHQNSWPFFSEEDVLAVSRVLQSGKVNQWTGQEVYEFEKEYRAYLGVKYAIALANGSVALDLALIVLGIKPGDEVIVTPRTFVASVHCIVLRGATPVFADVDCDSQNITLESVKSVFTNKTKAIIAVDVFGHPCPWDDLEKIAAKYKLKLIEDSCEALGSEYKKKKAAQLQ